MTDLFGMPTSWGDETPTVTADDLDALANGLEELGAERPAHLVYHAAELLRFLVGDQTDDGLTASIWIDPARQGGTPCVMGHRIPTRDIAENVAGGISVDALMSDFGLQRRDVLVACWWEWQYSDAVRPGLVEWAERSRSMLARSGDLPPDPPT